MLGQVSLSSRRYRVLITTLASLSDSHQSRQLEFNHLIMESPETRIKAGVELATIIFFLTLKQNQLGNGPLIQVQCLGVVIGIQGVHTYLCAN